MLSSSFPSSDLFFAEERMKLYKVMLEYGEQKGGKEVKQEMLNVGLLYCCTRGLTKDDPWNFILQSGADINGKYVVLMVAFERH